VEPEYSLQFRKIPHWTTSWARWIKFTSSYSISVISIKYCTHSKSRLPKWWLSWGFLTKILYVFLISHMCCMLCQSSTSWFYLPNNSRWVEITKLSLYTCSASRYFISSVPRSHTLPITVFHRKFGETANRHRVRCAVLTAPAWTFPFNIVKKMVKSMCFYLTENHSVKAYWGAGA